MTTKNSPPPIAVAVTGAAGQIGYALLFRIASGQMLGENQPVSLRLLEIPEALPALKGVAMELQDSAFPLLDEVSCTAVPEEAFDGVGCALLVGARPRSKGMERSDLLQANAGIFSLQGAALGQMAARDVRVLVVGNPANTNALIALSSAKSLAPEQFSAMTRLDHNRAVGALADRAGCACSEIRRVIIWGNHSTTQYPDLSHSTVGGKPALEVVDPHWYRQQMIPAVQNRGAEVIAARGASSAASAANAAVDHMRSWMLGTATGDWTSMGVISDGSYGIPKGIVYSFPVTCQGGDWQIVQGLEISAEDRSFLDHSAGELLEEKQALAGLL